MTIEAIPTVYDSVEYASRLEARWAIFFKQSGIGFCYEPRGKGSLPDFLFSPVRLNTKTNTATESQSFFLEVKGQPPNKNYIKLLQDKDIDYLAIGGFFKGSFPVLLRLQPFVENVNLLNEFSDYTKYILRAFNNACSYRFDLS